jgi:hypothetical protein
MEFDSQLFWNIKPKLCRFASVHKFCNIKYQSCIATNKYCLVPEFCSGCNQKCLCVSVPTWCIFVDCLFSPLWTALRVCDRAAFFFFVYMRNVTSNFCVWKWIRPQNSVVSRQIKKSDSWCLSDRKLVDNIVLRFALSLFMSDHKMTCSPWPWLLI